MEKSRKIDVQFHRACARGTVEEVRELAARGADVESEVSFPAGDSTRVGKDWESDCFTPVYRAAALNPRVEVVRFLVEELGADMMRLANKDDVYRTPLFYAARRNTPEIVAYLVDHGECATWENQWDDPVIDEAATNPDVGVLEVLMERGAMPDIGTLDGAIGGGTPEMMARLVGLGLDLGEAMKIWGVQDVPVENLRWVLEHGWDPNSTWVTPEGRTIKQVDAAKGERRRLLKLFGARPTDEKKEWHERLFRVRKDGTEVWPQAGEVRVKTGRTTRRRLPGYIAYAEARAMAGGESARQCKCPSAAEMRWVIQNSLRVEGAGQEAKEWMDNARKRLAVSAKPRWAFTGQGSIAAWVWCAATAVKHAKGETFLILGVGRDGKVRRYAFFTAAREKNERMTSQFSFKRNGREKGETQDGWQAAVEGLGKLRAQDYVIVSGEREDFLQAIRLQSGLFNVEYNPAGVPWQMELAKVEEKELRRIVTAYGKGGIPGIATGWAWRPLRAVDWVRVDVAGYLEQRLEKVVRQGKRAEEATLRALGCGQKEAANAVWVEMLTWPNGQPAFWGGKCERLGKRAPARTRAMADAWAAFQGGSISQFHLGEAFWKGRGVKKDERLALFWLDRASRWGMGDATDLAKSIRESLAKTKPPKLRGKNLAADSRSFRKNGMVRGDAYWEKLQSKAGCFATAMGLASARTFLQFMPPGTKWSYWTLPEIQREAAKLKGLPTKWARLRVAEFRRTAQGRRVYDGAPEGAKQFYQRSLSSDHPLMAEPVYDLYRTMDDASWDYIIEHAWTETLRKELKETRAHMQGQPEGTKMFWWKKQSEEDGDVNIENWKVLVERCKRMDKTEEEAFKKRWLEMLPSEIWKMTPEEVAKTGVMLNRNNNIRMITQKLAFPSFKDSRARLWGEMA